PTAHRDSKPVVSRPSPADVLHRTHGCRNTTPCRRAARFRRRREERRAAQRWQSLHTSAWVDCPYRKHSTHWGGYSHERKRRHSRREPKSTRIRFFSRG